MPYELRYGNPFTPGMGAAISRAESNRESFARSVEQQRINLQARQLDIKETGQQMSMTLAKMNQKREDARIMQEADQWRQGKLFARDQTAAALQAKGFRAVQADAEGNLPQPDASKGETLVTLRSPGAPDQVLIGISDDWQQQQAKLQARDQIQEKRAGDLIATGAEELTAPEDVAAAQKEGRLTTVGYSDGTRRQFRAATRQEAADTRRTQRLEDRTATDEKQFQLAGGRLAAQGETAAPEGSNAVKDASGRTWFVPSENWQKARQQMENDWRQDAIRLESDTRKELAAAQKAFAETAKPDLDPDTAMTTAAKRLEKATDPKAKDRALAAMAAAKEAKAEQQTLQNRIARARAAKQWVADHVGKPDTPPDWMTSDDAWLPTAEAAQAKYGQALQKLQTAFSADPNAQQVLEKIATAMASDNAYERNVAAATLEQFMRQARARLSAGK